jgi:hypothetical protein
MGCASCRIIPLASAVITVAGFLFGVYQFIGQQKADAATRLANENASAASMAVELRRANEAREREFRRPYWEKQLELYFAASAAAATIATAQNKDSVAAAKDEFWKLYCGPLAVVEDAGLKPSTEADVEPAMVRFGAALAQKPDDNEELRRLSLKLSHSVRSSIGKSWDVKLADLKGKYNRSSEGGGQ